MDVGEIGRDSPAKVVYDVLAGAQRRLGRSRGRLRITNEGEDLQRRVGLSVSAYLEDHMLDIAGADETYMSVFLASNLVSYDHAIRCLRLLEIVSAHLSNRAPSVWSPSDTRKPKLEALIELHAHALVVTAETRVLLANGYPNGAGARWRTLHEVVVTARLLSRRGQRLARRYLDSLDVELDRQIRSGTLLGPPSTRTAQERGLAAEAAERAAAAITKHGADMIKRNGWARPVVKKGPITFKSLEKEAGASRRRAVYDTASGRVHAGRFGSLEAVVDRRYSNGLYTGPRSTGVARVGLMTVWGLDEVAALVLSEIPAPCREEAEIWSECHAELAGHADSAFRRAGITVAVKQGDAETIEQLTPSFRMNFMRMLRDIETPQPRD